MRAALAAALLLPVACGGAPRQEVASAPRADEVAVLEFVETQPVDTSFDDGSFRATHEVWAEMIAGADETIELEHFYASNEDGSRLEPIVAALLDAADRGVEVRFTADRMFYDREYKDTLDRLDARENVEVVFVDFRPLTGGIQHAKCMLVDGEDLYVGSANFDWRALEHIQELGVRVRSREVGAWFAEVLAYDRALASGAEPARRREGGARPTALATLRDAEDGDATLRVSPAFSPKGALPDESTWDLPVLLEWIGAAREAIELQVLSYKPVDREGEWWPELDDALRAAAARGVRVRLTVADWSDQAGSIEPLASLAALEHCAVRFVRIPAHASGEIPFARVVHAKFLVVDEDRAWVGTSNWQRGYFTKSRNLGLFLEGEAPARELRARFDRTWSSDYADPVPPAADATRPFGAEGGATR